ncbi:hypothetical protein EV702DRAFT_1137778, partial [Suillus placidus]
FPCMFSRLLIPSSAVSHCRYLCVVWLSLSLFLLPLPVHTMHHDYLQVRLVPFIFTTRPLYICISTCVLIGYS